MESPCLKPDCYVYGNVVISVFVHASFHCFAGDAQKRYTSIIAFGVTLASFHEEVKYPCVRERLRTC